MASRNARGVAFHEAGHVVVALALSIPVRGVHIGPLLGKGRAGYVETRKVGPTRYNTVWESPWAVRSNLSSAVACQAGLIAEKRATGHDARRQNLKGDIERGYNCAARFSLQPATIRSMIRWSERMAAEILEAHWPAVKALAKQICLEFSLTPDQIVAVVDEVDPTLVWNQTAKKGR
jgi:hypothetical protein